MGNTPRGRPGGSRGYAASEWQQEGCRRRPRPRARKAGFSWQDPPCPGGSVCPGCVPVSPAEREGLGSASQSRVGVNRRLDGSSYEGCSQGGRGLQGGLRPGHPSWLRSRALAIGHPVPGWGAVLRTLPTTRSQEASRRANVFPWPFYCPGQAPVGERSGSLSCFRT